MNSSDITIAVQSGTTSQLYAVDNLQNSKLNVFDSFDLAVADLKAGDADFLLGDLAVLDFAVENAADGFSVVETLKKKILELELEKNTGEPESQQYVTNPNIGCLLAIVSTTNHEKIKTINQLNSE